MDLASLCASSSCFFFTGGSDTAYAETEWDADGVQRRLNSKAGTIEEALLFNLI